MNWVTDPRCKLKSLSPMLVMISSMSVPICNQVHATRDNSGKITSIQRRLARHWTSECPLLDKVDFKCWLLHSCWSVIGLTRSLTTLSFDDTLSIHLYVNSGFCTRMPLNRTRNWNRFRSINQYQSDSGKRRRKVDSGVAYMKTTREVIR